jgi:pheromone a factor receptor
MAAVRQQQVRKKLYLMTLVCIIIVLPLILVMLTLNIIEGAPWNLPYNFDALHYGPDPFNVRFISFTTSDKMTFTSLNIAYISEVSSLLVFITFGSTPEALNMFREQLLFLRLGYIFPKLKEEYVPSPKRSPWRNWGPFARPLHVRSLLGTKYVIFTLHISSTMLTTPQQQYIHPQG